MQRDVAALSDQTFDVLVVGGGIYGACVARDAALRGLSVALVERGDFGGATSANSLKIIHGGLRYLPDGDLGHARQMARERAAWLRIAPHLVQPLACLLPTERRLARRKAVLRAALLANERLEGRPSARPAFGRRLPPGTIISRAELVERTGYDDPRATGAARWYDAQIVDSERLLLAVIQSAAEAGATVANYTAVTALNMRDGRVLGATAQDVLTGEGVTIAARLTVNCAGPWADALLGRAAAPTFPPSLAINLVTRRLPATCALGFAAEIEGGDGRRRRQVLFAVPWRDVSIVGTLHEPGDGQADAPHVAETTIARFIRAVNAAYPAAALRREDVYHVHAGLLPAVASGSRGNVRLQRRSRVHDHARRDGLDGLLTVTGVKYTTARHAAEQAVNLAQRRLGRRVTPCRTAETPLAGGAIGDWDAFLATAVAEHGAAVEAATLRQLAHSYGDDFRRILATVNDDPTLGLPLAPGGHVLRAQVVHAVREEMAQTLRDVVRRRVPVGGGGLPDAETLAQCARLIGGPLGWDTARQAREIEAVRAAYARHQPPPGPRAAAPPFTVANYTLRNDLGPAESRA